MDFLNRAKFQTPESVELEFTLAGIGSRALALLIDYNLLLVFITVFLTLWAFLSRIFLELTDELNLRSPELWIIAIAFLGAFVLYVGYFVFFESLWRGQTPGKRLVHIRVICSDGRPASLTQATLRALLRPIDEGFFYIGAFIIAFSKQERRLGDFVAGTLVIEEERPTKSASFPISNQAQSLTLYVLEQGDISRLSPDEFAYLRDYLQRRKELERTAKQRLSQDLAQQFKEAIALEKVPEQTIADHFLEAVYLAYQERFQGNNSNQSQPY